MKKLIVLALLTLASPCLVLAQEDVEDFDTIVRKLSGANKITTSVKVESDNPLDMSEIHVGAGIANEFSNVTTVNGRRVPSNQKGFQAALGIDLFSPYWLAEGTVRSFSDQTSPDVRTGLREFDLKVLHKARVTDLFRYRLGGGLAARYLNIQEKQEGAPAMGPRIEYVTPASILTAGLEARFNSWLSVGTDVAYRSAMIADTIDQNSFDFVVRVDAHF
jgi:hypothetical protein